MLVFTLGGVDYVDWFRILWSLAFRLLFYWFLKTRLVITYCDKWKKNEFLCETEIKEFFVPAPFPFLPLIVHLYRLLLWLWFWWGCIFVSLFTIDYWTPIFSVHVGVSFDLSFVMLCISVFLGCANVAGKHLYMSWNFYTNMFCSMFLWRRLGDKALLCFGPPRRLGGGDSPQLALTP